jgi:hypothetical protein
MLIKYLPKKNVFFNTFLSYSSKAKNFYSIIKIPSISLCHGLLEHCHPSVLLFSKYNTRKSYFNGHQFFLNMDFDRLIPVRKL